MRIPVFLLVISATRGLSQSGAPKRVTAKNTEKKRVKKKMNGSRPMSYAYFMDGHQSAGRMEPEG
jgi:hypothetical protein